MESYTSKFKLKHPLYDKKKNFFKNHTVPAVPRRQTLILFRGSPGTGGTVDFLGFMEIKNRYQKISKG